MAKPARPRPPKGITRMLAEQSAAASASGMYVLGTQDRPWFLVETPPARETQTLLAAQEVGASGILPVRTVYRRQRFKREKVRRTFPILPRALFLAPSSPRLWFDLFDQGLIQSVMSVNGMPRAIPRAELLDFLGRAVPELTAPNVHRFMPSRHEYSVGDHVEVLQGAFSGHTVEVTEIKGQHASVLCDVLGAMRPVTVRLDNLAAI